MKERVYRVLNIKISESSQVFDLLTVQFFIGLANALINIIAFALFIYNFPIHYLPDVYLVVAVLLFLANMIYEKLEHRYSPLQMVRFVIAFAMVLLFILWIGLSYFDKHTFIFMLLVASVLIYMVTGYAFWGLVSLLFNVRESRRVFSIVGSGDIPAKIIGYLVGPLLMPFLGLNNLLWLAIISLAVGIIMFGRFTRKPSWDVIRKKSHTDHQHEHHKEKKSSSNIVKFLFQNKLIFAISLLSILSYNVYVLIDYTFISQVKLRFENISDLAAYIAIFFAFGRIIALVFKLIFTSRMIEKLGIISCLFITPVALFFFCFLLFQFSDNSNSILFIFGLMAMLTEVLRSTIQEPVFFILFQPLKENLRLKGHIISKGYMYPPSLIVVGLSLFFLHRAGISISIHLAIKVVVINLLVWVAVIFLIRRTYLSTVHASIRKGTFRNDDIFINDQQGQRLLLEKVESGRKVEVIYALNMLETAGYNGFREVLQNQLLQGREVEVKNYALDKAEEKQWINTDMLRQLLAQQPTGEFREKLINLLCRFDPGYLKNISTDIESLDHPIRKIVIINLLNEREFNYLYKAGSEINKLVNSKDSSERLLAIEIISELKHVQFSDAVAMLIEDGDHAVRRGAITAACNRKMDNLLPSVMLLLERPAEKNMVLKGLQSYGDQLFEEIVKPHSYTSIVEKHRSDFIRLATRLKGKPSAEFLLAHIGKGGFLQDLAVHAIWVRDFEPVGTENENRFRELLYNYLQKGMEKIEDHSQVPDLQDEGMLKASVQNEVRKDLELALKLCSLLYRKKEINRVLELLAIEKKDKLYNAMEMLELVLPKRISKEINLLFDFLLDPVHQYKLQKMEARNFYEKAIFNKPQMYNPWTRSVCLYYAWKHRDEHILQKLEAPLTFGDHFLIRETRQYVLENKNLQHAHN